MVQPVINVSNDLLAGGQDARSPPGSSGKQAGSHQCIASCRGMVKQLGALYLSLQQLLHFYSCHS